MWEVAVAFLVGIGVSEYYNRGRIDRIRQEQLKDLRAHRSQQQKERETVYIERPAARRAKDDLISPEQYDEMQRTGRTAGRRDGGAL